MSNIIETKAANNKWTEGKIERGSLPHVLGSAREVVQIEHD